MSLKSQSRRIGRMLRRITKHSLPICMKMAKMIVRNQESLLPEKFPGIVALEELCSCCGREYIVRDKEGFSVIRSFVLNPGEIEKEYNIQQKLKAVPMGTTVL